jgi:hypothetical protein
MEALAQAISSEHDELKKGYKYPLVGEKDGIRIYGCTSPGGHLMAKDLATGRVDSYHILVWERANGPIPKGMEIHHIDGNPQNNNLSNLMMLSAGDHVKVHHGYFKVGGKWHKRCGVCGLTKSEDEFSKTCGGRGLRYLCKACRNQRAREKRAKLKREQEAQCLSI